MNSKTMAELEVLEEKIENLKWLIPPIYFLQHRKVYNTLPKPPPAPINRSKTAGAENLLWLSPKVIFLKRTSIAISFIKKTAGILSKDFPKGAIFENNSRGAWKLNFVKRTRKL